MDAPRKGLRRSVTHRMKLEDANEINITPVMNLFICLIPFLLISAVFLELAVIETSAVATGGSSGKESSLAIVSIRPGGFTVAATGKMQSGAKGAIQIPKRKGSYDFNRLQKVLTALKLKDSKAEDVLILAQRKVKYSVLIETMDACRENEAGDLFPNPFFGGTL